MTEPLDVEYVELRARGEDDAVREIVKALKLLVADVRKTATTIEQTIKTSFDDAASAAKTEMSAVTATIAAETAQQVRDVRDVGQALAADITTGAQAAQAAVDDMADHVERDMNRIEREARDAGRTIATSIGAGAAMGGLFSSLAQVGAQLRGISALLPSPLVAALVAAAPVIAALAGTLLDLGGILLTLPGLIGVVVAAAVPLVMAFSGISDAVTALASGDLEKIKEAFKSLAPAAREFAKEVNALRKPLRELKKDVQQAFFFEIRGGLTELVERAMPTLQFGLTGVSGALGRMADAILELFSSQRVLSAVGALFSSTMGIIDSLTPHVIKLLDTLFQVIEHALPHIERMAAALGRGMDALAGFLDESLDTGEFWGFIDDAFTAIKDLAGLAVSLGRLLSAMFGNLGDEGHTFLQTLTDIVDEMTAFFKSAEGQAVMQDLVDLLPLLVAGLRGGLLVLGAFAVMQHNILETLKAVGAAVISAAQAVGDFFVAAWDKAGDAVGAASDAIAGAYDSTVEFLARIGSAISDFVNDAVAFFQALPERVMNFLSALPGLVESVIRSMIDSMLFAIGFGLGVVVRYFAELPQNVYDAAVGLVGIVISLFRQSWDGAKRLTREAVDVVMFMLNELPIRVANVGLAFGRRVREFFTSTKDSATSTVRGMVDSIGRFLSELPGRAASAFTAMRSRIADILGSIARGAYGLGRSIMTGIVDGIRDLISWVVDWAKYAARRILDGFGSAIRIGSPSKASRDKVGKPLMQGIGVGIDDETPSVIQTIQNAMSRTLAAAAGSGAGVSGGDSTSLISFGAGAVQVIFQGAVPTEQEARRTGAAIGDSIAQTLARRAVRTAVRTA